MRPARILVVDDSLTIRRALEFILKPHGYELEFAADGSEALSRAISFAPDLVLLDYVLPDMRGPDVCAALALAATTESTPVILVSAKGASIRQAYQDAQNVVSYITKPFKAEIVSSVVANALARVRAGAPASAANAATDAESANGAAPASSGQSSPQPTARRRSPEAAPATVEETFSVLLGQLEDAIAADAVDGRASDRSGSRAAFAQLAPGLARASARMREVAQHLVGGDLAPYRIRPDGSFASIAATLLDAHRSLCETAIALAAAGAPGARRPERPRVLAAGPADHDVFSGLAGAFAVAPEVRTVALTTDFASLPCLVKLLAPEFVAVVPGCDPALDEALRRAVAVRPERTQFIALGAATEGFGDAFSETRLETSEAARQWVGDLARAGTGATATGVEIALEIVTV